MENKLIFTNLDNHMGCFQLKDDCLYKASFFTEQSDEVGKIYVGHVSNVMPNLNACFVEYQKGQHGFLPLKKEELACIKCESRILVQVKKAKVKTKEAVLTTEISIPGLYCVGFLGSNQIKFSKKIDEEKKHIIKEYLSDSVFLNSYVIRSHVSSLEETDYQLIKNEMLKMEAILNYIKDASNTRSFCTCLSKEKDYIVHSLSEISFVDFPKIITDDKQQFDYITSILPKGLQNHVSLYEDEKFPLSALYGLRSKVSEAISKTIWLKSGGYLVVEPTEAMVVIDVNTGKNIKKQSKEDLIKTTNKEAAEALAHILPAANYSGIIIVDFINYINKADEEKLMNYLKTLLKDDPIKTEVIDMTSLGLVEITRRKNDSLLSAQVEALGITL